MTHPVRQWEERLCQDDTHRLTEENMSAIVSLRHIF
jgi:hypothetical protein